MATTNAPGLDPASAPAPPVVDQAALPLRLRLAVVVATVVCVPLVLRALGRLAAMLRCWSSAKARTEPVPHVSSVVPLIGHALELRRRGARYLHELIVNTPADIFTIDVLGRRVLVVNPSLDRALAKHVGETSLARVVSLVGRRSLGMSEAAVATIAEYDPRPVHSQLFSNSQGSAALAEAAAGFIREHVRRQPREQRVPIGAWLFGMVVGASAHSLWGPHNPWSQDAEFMRQFVILSDNFESLSQPMARWTSSRAYQARQFLLERLMAFHREHRRGVETTVAHRINAIAMSDAAWEDNVDYYRCELLEALGLLATASTLSVWLVRHVLADAELRRKIVDEVRRLPMAGGDDGVRAGAGSASSPSSSAWGRVDASQVRASCPHLVAAWHETLRLHVTAVPRVATGDFELAVPSRGRAVTVRENDVLLLPMLSFNVDAATWGADAETFAAERFLDGAGRLSASRARRVRGFGVAGNLCPGRNFGFETAMAAVATLLRDFDIEAGAWPAPRALAAVNVGFERLADDVTVGLTRVDDAA